MKRFRRKGETGKLCEVRCVLKVCALATRRASERARESQARRVVAGRPTSVSVSVVVCVCK